MENKGYTIPELIVVAVVVGIFSIVAINKASYAFVDTNEITEETEDLIIIKSAISYANNVKDTLVSEKTLYISTNDLIDGGYLIDDVDYQNINIKIEYKEATDSISAEVLR
jgi:prepilin-type N-terminal cleavage/methylation domain-containing protein